MGSIHLIWVLRNSLIDDWMVVFWNPNLDIGYVYKWSCLTCCFSCFIQLCFINMKNSDRNIIDHNKRFETLYNDQSGIERASKSKCKLDTCPHLGDNQCNHFLHHLKDNALNLCSWCKGTWNHSKFMALVCVTQYVSLPKTCDTRGCKRTETLDLRVLCYPFLLLDSWITIYVLFWVHQETRNWRSLGSSFYLLNIFNCYLSCGHMELWLATYFERGCQTQRKD